MPRAWAATLVPFILRITYAILDGTCVRPALCVQVDWDKQVVHLTVRAASGGGIATGSDGKPQHLAFSLQTCAPLPA